MPASLSFCSLVSRTSVRPAIGTAMICPSNVVAFQQDSSIRSRMPDFSTRSLRGTMPPESLISARLTEALTTSAGLPEATSTTTWVM